MSIKNKKFKVGDLITTRLYEGLGVVLKIHKNNLRVFWCRDPRNRYLGDPCLVDKRKCKHITRLAIL